MARPKPVDLPVLPLRGVGIFPGALVPVLLAREVSMRALAAARGLTSSRYY